MQRLTIAAAALLLWALVTLVAVGDRTARVGYGSLAIAALVVALAVAAAGVQGSGSIDVPARRGDVRFVAALTAAFVASRALWVLSIPTIPQSDFAFYDGLAREIARGGPITAVWPHGGILAAWGYPALLAPLYALGGADLAWAKLLNVLLGAASLLLLYDLTHTVAGRTAARVTALLWLLWPAQLMMSSLPASENAAVAWTLIGFVLVARSVRASARVAWLAGFGGVALGLASATRSVLGTAVVAAAVFLALEDRAPRGRRMIRAGGLVAGLLSVWLFFEVALWPMLGAAPRSAGWWSIYVGANPASLGMWNEPDSKRYFAHSSIEQANEFARAEALRRIAADPRGWLALAGRKVVALWSDDGYALYWSSLGLEATAPGAALSARAPDLHEGMHGFLLGVLALAAVGAVALAFSGPPFGATLLAAFLVTGTLVHGIVESQSRYHYSLAPALFALAAVGASALAATARSIASGSGRRARERRES